MSSQEETRYLVPLDTSDHSRAATLRACEIAKRTNATLTGLAVVDSHGIQESVALPFMADYADFPRPNAVIRVHNAISKLDLAGEVFLNTCKEYEVKAEFLRLSGTPANGILDRIRFHDLGVFGMQSHFHFETEPENHDTLRLVLNHSAIPILLCPSFESDPIRRVIIAFDGSEPSTRAMHRFAEFWPIYKPEVRIVTGTGNAKSGGHLLDQAQKFLQRKGVETITTSLEQEALTDSFEKKHLEWSDLIVAGIRSRTSLKRFFIGSFANYLIEESHRSLLLSQ